MLGQEADKKLKMMRKQEKDRIKENASNNIGFGLPQK